MSCGLLCSLRRLVGPCELRDRAGLRPRGASELSFHSEPFPRRPPPQRRAAPAPGQRWGWLCLPGRPASRARGLPPPPPPRRAARTPCAGALVEGRERRRFLRRRPAGPAAPASALRALPPTPLPARSRQATAPPSAARPAPPRGPPARRPHLHFPPPRRVLPMMSRHLAC